jgi:hypothetical protein
LLQGKVDLKFRIEGSKGEPASSSLTRSAPNSGVC